MTVKEKQSKAETRSLNDRAYDLLGEMLLERETDAILSAIDGEKASGKSKDMDAFFVRYDVKNRNRIRRYVRRRQAHTLFFETLPKIGRIAAVLIALLAVAGGAAIAASHTVRAQVMKMLVHMEETYTELSLAEDPEASFDFPSEWEGEYYPSYIPEGWVMSAVYPWPGNNSVEYKNGDTGEIQIYFSEYDASTEANVDTEDSVVREVTINGNTGFLSAKMNRIILYWDNGRVYFVLITTGFDETTALKIAESVARVK